MTANQLPERIIRKIRALKAMANDASSENEAMIAGRQLYILLAKYGVDEVNIDLDEGDAYATETLVYDHKTTGLWCGVIAQNVAQLYFCHTYQSTNGGSGKTLRRTFHITGSNSFRHIARMMVNRIITLVDQEARATVGSRPAHDDPWSYICSFRTAAATRIAKRCQEMIREGREGRLVDEDGNKLPVLVPMFERETNACRMFLDGKVKLVKSSQSAARNSAAGRSAGDSFGNRVGLRQELGGAVGQRLIGRG